MSHYWNYACNTCDVESDGAINHGEKTLLKIAAVRDYIKKVHNAADGWIEVEVMGQYGLISFLCEHANHDLSVKSEYNYPPLPIPPLERLIDRMDTANNPGGSTETRS